MIDGKIGYIGGFNVGDEYLGKGPLGAWRDTHLRIIGMPFIHCNRVSSSIGMPRLKKNKDENLFQSISPNPGGGR